MRPTELNLTVATDNPDHCHRASEALHRAMLGLGMEGITAVLSIEPAEDMPAETADDTAEGESP